MFLGDKYQDVKHKSARNETFKLALLAANIGSIHSPKQSVAIRDDELAEQIEFSDARWVSP